MAGFSIFAIFFFYFGSKGGELSQALLLLVLHFLTGAEIQCQQQQQQQPSCCLENKINLRKAVEWKATRSLALNRRLPWTGPPALVNHLWKQDNSPESGKRKAAGSGPIDRRNTTESPEIETCWPPKLKPDLWETPPNFKVLTRQEAFRKWKGKPHTGRK